MRVHEIIHQISPAFESQSLKNYNKAIPNVVEVDNIVVDSFVLVATIIKSRASC